MLLTEVPELVEKSGKPSPEQIYRQLRERICLLDIEPGERLPEEALAAEFGVSRTPIRQALDRLEFERLVVQKPGAGATVAPVDMKSVRDVWALRLKVAELVGEFVRLPASERTLGELTNIRAELDTIRATRDVRALGALYNRFHASVLEVFSNETLRWIHDVLFHQTARVWMQFLPEMELDAEIDLMAEEVELTIDAMQGTSGAWLAEIRTKHMQMLLNRFNEHVTRPLI